MDINSASTAVAAVTEAREEGKGSVTRSRDLSAQERIFVDVFIANGGKAGEAARAAGYADASADVTACKLLCRSRVAEHIKNQVGKFAHSTIPLAVQTLVACAGDGKALWKDRLKAANSLIDLAGIAPKGPGIQVNVGVVNGSQAQAIISEVHEARARRLSDIPTAMPDTLDQDMMTLRDAIDVTPADQGGGDQLQGPASGSCPLPPLSSEQPSESGDYAPSRSDGSIDDAAASFRRAFDDDE